MIKNVFSTVILIFLMLCCVYNVDASPIQDNQSHEYKNMDMELEEELKRVKSKSAREYLVKFIGGFNNDDEISFTEYEGHFEIIVSHPSTTDPSGDQYSGGAEQYLLNKKTGKSEMGWHEHPMKLPQIIEEQL